MSKDYKHGIRLWTIVLEISVLMASFPSEAIAKLSYHFRTLGLGYANLGAMLMQAGIPYDSDKGRAICGALTAILTGESYADQRRDGPRAGSVPRLRANQNDMLRVIRNHRRAAYDVEHTRPGRARPLGRYEKLDIHPVGIDASAILRRRSDGAALAARRRPRMLGPRAATGRTARLSQRPDDRHRPHRHHRPADGLRHDRRRAGLCAGEVQEARRRRIFQDRQPVPPPRAGEPRLRRRRRSTTSSSTSWARSRCTTPRTSATSSCSGSASREAELEKIEAALPGTFEISFAFSPWSLGADVSSGWRSPKREWQAPNFNLLRRLGFTRKQIDEANDVDLRPRHRRRCAASEGRASSGLRLRQQVRQAWAGGSSPSKATSA